MLAAADVKEQFKDPYSTKVRPAGDFKPLVIGQRKQAPKNTLAERLETEGYREDPTDSVPPKPKKKRKPRKRPDS
jgi:hypothetical protein